MSSRVILQFNSDDGGEAACGEDDCARRWECILHGAMAAGMLKCHRPSAELVFVGETATLTCHDYWQGKGEGDGEAHGR